MTTGWRRICPLIVCLLALFGKFLTRTLNLASMNDMRSGF